MPSVDDRCAKLEEAIAFQEAQRAVLGNEVVDTTVSALRAQIEALRSGRKPAAPAQPDTEQLLRSLHGHIPKELVDKMMAVGDIKGERRQVTVLFADLTGYTALSESLDPEEVAGLIQEILKELARAVFENEGYVDKYIGDAVMAVFGAPVAHEDDAERALRSALSMMERLEEFNRRYHDRIGRPLGLHIGVNTGLVVAGNVDAELRMPYSVLGDTVNTASRLEGAAETGQILLSQSTWRLTREAFVFRALDPVEVKGKSQPLAVYELQRAKLTPTKTRGLRDLGEVFVGREGEIGRLRGVTDTLQAGAGQIVMVTGEAGIGKSRLMAEWRRELEGKGAAVWLEGRCHPTTSSIAYGPFLDLVRRSSGIDEEQSEGMARRRLDLSVERFFPGEARVKIICANLLALRLSPEEQEVLAGIPAKQLREEVFGLMEGIFTALAKESPAVIAIEDIHWADTTSLDLLEHLFPLTEGNSLAVVGVSRPGPEGSHPFASARERYGDRFTSMTLSPLSDTGSTEMVAGLLTLEEIPAALQEIVVGKTEGNPFFVEEVIRTLIEKGALTRTGKGRWEATALIETVTVPDTLQGLLMARLDGLPPDTKWLSQQAAVIGRIFLYRVLREMCETGSDIDAGLSRMEQDDLVRKRALDPEIEYMFRHALTQEVAYESLLLARRRELHRLVGETMERLFAERIGEFTSIIGEHFLKGEAWEKAADYLSEAADASARLYAHAEERKDYSKTLEALARLPDAVETRRRRVDVTVKFSNVSYMGLAPHEILGRLEDAERLAESLPGPDGKPGTDRLRLTRVHYQIGLIHYSANRMREAIGYHRKVLAAAPELDEPELLGIPSFAIGNVLLFQGHMGEARKLLGEGMIALMKTENWFFWTRAVAMRSLAMTMMGDCRAAQAEGEQARDRGREINASLLIVSSNLMLSAAYLYENPSGDGLKRTLEASREGLETAEKAGDRVLLYLSYGVLAWNLAMGGRFDEASAVMEKCLSLAKQSGGQLIMLDQFTARQADITLGLGRVEETLNLAEQAIGIARQMGGIWAEGHARRTLGRALAALTPPRRDEAEAQMAQSVQLMESGQNLMGVAHTEIAWGEVCRDRCNLDDARDHWGKAAAFFESKGLTKRVEQVQALIAI